MGIWTQVPSGNQSLIQQCSQMLQSSRPRYKGHLTYNNLSKLLAQKNRDDKSDMFEMFLYQDDNASPYDMVLVEYLTLKRDGSGKASRHHWCLTYGLSPATAKNANQLYPILKAEVKDQLAHMPGKDSLWFVYLDGDNFNSGSLFDQIFQLLMNDVRAGNVQLSADQAEPTYAQYLADFGKTTLHRFQIQNVN
jgi:hypothetical protein